MFLTCLCWVVLIIVLYLMSFFVKWDRRFEELSRNIPMPPGIPIFGNTFQLLVPSNKLMLVFDTWAQKYGHRLLYRVGTYWIVGLSNPQDVEKLFTSTTETVKSVDYDQLIPWLGTGLLISNGEKWTKRRKLLTPAFHFKILEKFIDVFNRKSFKFVEVIKRKYQPGQKFDVAPVISKLTLDIICETAMGVEINALENDEDTEYISAISRMKFLQMHRAFRPWLSSALIWNLFSYGQEEKRLLNILHGFTNEVIQRRKKETAAQSLSRSSPKSLDVTNEAEMGRKRYAFLDLLLEALRNGDLKSDEDVREETDTFMFEGHDTVSAAIGFTLFFVGNHPDVYVKLRQEIQGIFKDDPCRPVEINDLGKMQYLECCIKESLRLCPSVPILARTIQHNFALDRDVILPPGTLVVVHPYQLHRNPCVYNDPLNFLPERFLSEDSRNRHPFSYIPFSAGPRNCIGQKFALMEGKVIIANILRNLQISAVDKLEQLTLKTELILQSDTGIQIKYNDY